METHLNWKRFLTVFLTGLRIFPGTEIARQAVEERIIRAIGRCPTIVHGAEENGSVLERFFNRTFSWLGVPPPYYRFLPVFLRLPPLPALRARDTSVRASHLGKAK